MKSMGIGETGVITASIMPVKEHYFYRRHGNWILPWSLLSVLSWSVWGGSEPENEKL